jgi:hypothetical protein
MLLKEGLTPLVFVPVKVGTSLTFLPTISFTSRALLHGNSQVFIKGKTILLRITGFLDFFHCPVF